MTDDLNMSYLRFNVQFILSTYNVNPIKHLHLQTHIFEIAIHNSFSLKRLSFIIIDSFLTFTKLLNCTFQKDITQVLWENSTFLYWYSLYSTNDMNQVQCLSMCGYARM